jgi:hypothetical protein
MSQRKFAPITSGLLVRKGEAAPSPIAPPMSNGPSISNDTGLPDTQSPSRAPTAQMARAVTWLADVQRRASSENSESRFVFSPEDTSAGSGPNSEGKTDNDKPRRIVLNLSAHEYETLGLVAVKKGTTRHHLAQQAMDAYFEWLVAEYGEACNCIVGGALCRCECSQ